MKKGPRDNKITELSKSLADDICEMISEGMDSVEIVTTLNIHNTSYFSWVTLAVNGDLDNLRPEMEPLKAELQKIGDAIWQRKKAFQIIQLAIDAVSKTLAITEKITLKETTVHALTKQEHQALERMGYHDFLEYLKDAEVILKIEKSREQVPPSTSLIEKLLKYADDEKSIQELKQQILDFAPTSPDLPDV